MTLTHTYTRTWNTVEFADPYKKCRQCNDWVDGYLDMPTGRLTLVPCEHESDYRNVCPSWSPVDGCGCADYSARHPDRPIAHEMRRPRLDDLVAGAAKIY